MLNKITLTNFQRHRNLEVVFNAGISALRGSNEAGKSTLIRAVCYALFGSKAMPVSLDELVTWGEPTNTLKVVLEFVVDGVVYTIKRGKSGAEINYDGGIVTGQNECTAFVSKLLKADAGAASKLMLANQNEIRGALEKGPAETTKLIEQLAEFDQLDNLIEKMEGTLTLGSPKVAEAAISNAEIQLEQARAAAVPVDVEGHDRRIFNAQADLELATKALDVHDTTVEVLRKEAHRLTDRAKDRDAAEKALEAATARLNRAIQQQVEAQAVKAPEPVDVKALRERIAQLADMGKVRAARAAVEPFLDEPSRPEDDRFEGTIEALQEEITQTRRQVTAAQRDRDTNKSRADLAESKISTGSCSTCGQDISHLPEVAARNAQLQAEVTEARKQQEIFASTHQGLTRYLQELEAIQKESTPRLNAFAKFESYLDIDLLLPPTLKWVGGEIPDNVEAEIDAIEKQIATFEAAQRAYDAANGRRISAEETVNALQLEHQELRRKLSLLPAVDPVPAQKALMDAQAKRPDLVAEQRNAQRNLDNEVRGKEDAIAAYGRAVKAAEVAELTLAARRKELTELAFNNRLLKDVRAARPVIADKLWNLVLAAVGRYFSEMRGSKSSVTKDTDGFKVDGHPSTTLSGSTLDILGLAIRVALTRTFLPTAPFLVLDEPAAAMDGERTELMLGFLVTCGFPQTLLVTHEDISESVADNVITI
ncbi:putative DNA double-strand break repair Rad50 ATPase [Variovorax sp. PBS-H4]|uniref:AAA family ATPase n=1 Tax=Variovorax sp. PBS-H4 TaxID=434008 RepID=UPI001318919E|nr:AAA family ATPase [Variovorax sp. PBS-H4]VTU31808.1 putative DNA double-strand break repair Rad50 ATPase [Variovorax sp. PBS-H4]